MIYTAITNRLESRKFCLLPHGTIMVQADYKLCYKWVIDIVDGLLSHKIVGHTLCRETYFVNLKHIYVDKTRNLLRDY